MAGGSGAGRVVGPPVAVAVGVVVVTGSAGAVPGASVHAASEHASTPAATRRRTERGAVMPPRYGATPAGDLPFAWHG